MDPSVYIPAYLERTYLASHPELTDAARELVHNDISANPQKYAQSEHAQALLSYAGVHRHLLDELHRIEDMGSDEEFEQTRNRLFAMSCSRSSASMRMSSMPSCSPSSWPTRPLTPAWAT